ncbi:MAG: Hsp20/alpha crystallin family protein [Promethearchaeota archaeon]
MNENQEKEEEIEPQENLEIEKESIENKKKEEEASIKRSKACQFKVDALESLEIKEDEPFYREPISNIIENEELYYIQVELPGLDKKNVQISLQEGILEICGEKSIKDKEKKEEKKEKDKKDKKDEKKEKDKKKEKEKEIQGAFLRREIRSNNFFRCFKLPEDISPEDIDASFKNGILHLKIPKKSVDTGTKKVIEIK